MCLGETPRCYTRINFLLQAARKPGVAGSVVSEVGELTDVIIKHTDTLRELRDTDPLRPSRPDEPKRHDPTHEPKVWRWCT